MGALEKISDPIPLDNSFQEANTMTVSLDAKENTTPVHSSFSQALLCSYNEAIDYSQDIETQFSYEPNGIYISQALANELQIIPANNQYYLTFYIMILHIKDMAMLIFLFKMKMVHINQKDILF